MGYDFQRLLNDDDNITVDNVVYIKYIDLFLWHKLNKIDRMNGSGDTQKSETWNNIKNRYSQHLKQKDDEKKDSKINKITVNINREPQPLQGRRKYDYYWNNTVSNMIENGFYEVMDKNGKRNKIKIEKILKKSYKKTKLYHEKTTFKFLTPTILDSVYRNYENMEINITNDTMLNIIYRLHANKDKSFKKICILNVYGTENGFYRNSTLSHSLNRYNYDISTDETDEASEYLYSNTMVYSPHCILFNDVNGELTANYFKVSFLTAYAVNLSEYYRIKRKIFDAPQIEKRLKTLDDKLNNVKKPKHKKNKSEKKIQEENEVFIAELNEMKDVIEGIMRDRIRRMIEIAIYNGCDAVIFDAFGCNAGFGNDVKLIAEIFSSLIESVYFNCFKSVTFSILEDTNNRNQSKRKCKLKENAKSIISKFRIFQEAFQSKFA